MTGTDLCVNKCKQSRSYLNHLVILPVVLYGCETWSHTLREERRPRVSEKRVLRRIFGPKRDDVTEEWKKYVMRNLMICTAHPVLFG